MLNPYYWLVAGILLATHSQAQSVGQLPESKISLTETEAQLRYLASDKLLGRRTGEPGNLEAARYIAEQFQKLGLKPAPGQSDYFQKVPLQVSKPALQGNLQIGDHALKLGNEFIVLEGDKADLSAESVYVGYGLTDGADGYSNQNVRGKIVITQAGSEEARSARQLIAASKAKKKLATEKGALAIIELCSGASFPWNMASRVFNSEQLTLAEGTQAGGLPVLWVDNTKNQLANLKEKSQKVTIQSSGRHSVAIDAVNVAGLVEGSDPKLKNEYVLLTAHFDHVGTGKNGGQPTTPNDTIFNGARDNAFGTVALLAAAKSLQAQRPKRSVLIVALNGEEVGLLGSRYYAEHPLVPLKQTVFDLNSDGAGYNDTTIVSVIGLERTGARSEIETACKAFGLSVFAEPAPEQGLFDRSDNVSLAAKGVPAPTFSAGFKTFDEQLFKYYHQAADNPETIDFNYLLKFCRAYAYTARLIANKPTRPQWMAGDKYEAAAKALYGQ